MKLYLITGLIFYVTTCFLRFKTFKNTDVLSVIKGLVLGVVFWPIAIIILYKDLR